MSNCDKSLPSPFCFLDKVAESDLRSPSSPSLRAMLELPPFVSDSPLCCGWCLTPSGTEHQDPADYGLWAALSLHSQWEGLGDIKEELFYKFNNFHKQLVKSTLKAANNSFQKKKSGLALNQSTQKHHCLFKSASICQGERVKWYPEVTSCSANQQPRLSSLLLSCSWL